MNAIEINNLTKEYKDFKLDDISLTLPSGYIMGLIGEDVYKRQLLLHMM